MAKDKDPKNGRGSAGYDAQDITVLEGLEAVRKRPGMYIGSTGLRGLHHLVYEVVDNSVDEALQGRCDHITVTIHPDTRVTVTDNGSGIPVGVMEGVGLPAADIFDETDYSFETLAQRLREMAFLTRGLRIELTDERAGGERADFRFEGGIRDFIAHVNDGKERVHKDVIYFDTVTDEGEVEVAMQWNGSYVESTFSFANNINTHEGGAHLSGFKGALTRTLNDYARNKGLLKDKEEPLTGDDVREGLAAIVSVKLRDPQFEGQTKTKLGNPWIRGLVESTCNARLGEYLEEHPTEAKQIVNKLIAASRARQAARKARDLIRRKTALGGGGLPGKLADCSLNHPG